MKTKNSKVHQRARRRNRIRSRLYGTAIKPRLAVFRSNTSIYAQLIDDDKGVTLVQANDIKGYKGSKLARAEQVGEALAMASAGKNIVEVIFDRGGFIYTGRVKALADAARKGGLKF